MTLLHHLPPSLSFSIFGLLFIFPFHLHISSISPVHHTVKTLKVCLINSFPSLPKFTKSRHICCLFLTSHFSLTTCPILSIVSTSLLQILKISASTFHFSRALTLTFLTVNGTASSQVLRLPITIPHVCNTSAIWSLPSIPPATFYMILLPLT